jgi:hypothetical protein
MAPTCARCEQVYTSGRPHDCPRAGTFVVHAKYRMHQVYIAGRSKWASPFRVGRDGSRAEVLAKYRAWLTERPALIEAARRDLRGKLLGCWCPPEPCHGGVLAEIANGRGA